MEYAAKMLIGMLKQFNVTAATVVSRKMCKQALNKIEVKRICNHCGIPNISTHHSIDLDDLKIVNYFQVIAPDSKNVLFDLRDSRSPSRDTPPHLFSTPKHQGKVNASNISDMSHILEVQSSLSRSVESEQTSSFLGFSADSSNNNSDLPDNTSQSHGESTNNLDFLVINFQSIRNKSAELYNIISSRVPDIIVGTETHSGDYDSEILPPNIPPEHKYQIFLKDRKETVNNCKGGGRRYHYA